MESGFEQGRSPADGAGGGVGEGAEDGADSSEMLCKKRQLRKVLLGKRDCTSGDYMIIAARSISDRLLRCKEIAGASAIGAYHPIGSEVPTSDIIRRVLAAGKRLYMPRVTSGSAMEFCRVHAESELVPGRIMRGVMEPGERADPASPEEMDAIVVPAVAASPDGHRLGYGRGYYDRFLARCRPDAFKVAPVLEKQVVRRIPAGPGDIRMDAIVTESGVTYPAGP